MRKRMLFIYNPFAGKGMLSGKLSAILRIFTDADYEVTVFPTRGPRHATKLVREYVDQMDYIVCAGGDGTLHEVTEGLMSMEPQKRKPCGYIPAGTVNDFANSLKIPKDFEEAAKTVVAANLYACDVGSTNGKCFTYFSGFGAFTDVSYETNQNAKNALGKLAYFLEGAKRVMDITSYYLNINYGNVEVKGDFIYGMICNTYSVGGLLKFEEEHVELNDGEFEAVFIRKPANILEVEKILLALKTDMMSCELITCFRASKITIRCHREIKWTLDGEYGGTEKEFVIENHRKAIEYAHG